MAIETVKHRSKLKVRREPYWHTMSTGRHVGYRRTNYGGAWIARYYDSGTRKRIYNALSDVSHLPPSEQFSAATKKAREWFEHLEKGGNPETITVREACERYVEKLRKDEGRGDKAANDAEARFRRYVNDDEISNVLVNKLAARHVEGWRSRMTNAPKVAHSKSGKPLGKRAKSTVNRDMVSLRAALNLAKGDGFTISDVAWDKPLKQIKDADRRRDLYLSRDERRAMIKALPNDAADFVYGLCHLPLRPGALASLKVANFNKRAGTLTVLLDKTGAGRKILLPDSVLALFARQSKGKLPGAHLFSRADGSAWNKDAWKTPVRAAVETAELPAGSTAYTIRHSVITDLVTSGLDSLTVAALSGTSVAMIEKHYYTLQQEHAREALEGLSL